MHLTPHEFDQAMTSLSSGLIVLGVTIVVVLLVFALELHVTTQDDPDRHGDSHG